MKIPNIITNFSQENENYIYDNSSKLGLAIELSGYYTFEELITKLETIKDAHFSLNRDNEKLI